ncbi:hypothetical protein BDW22DRAFT_1394496 [Trametopsis cervina]|nr:hypothetical protein BDW22DRAFT_1394496 [Trametopsis cervina]
MSSNPNFPPNLDIRPSQASANETILDGFDEASQAKAIRTYGIAGRVWEAAYALKTYIDAPPSLEFDPPFLQEDDLTSGHPIFLELGSGTGIVAAWLAERHAHVPYTLVATDLPEVCPLLEKNLINHAGQPSPSHVGRVLVRPLAWGNEQHAADIASELLSSPSTSDPRVAVDDRYLTHVICSDLVYFPELLAPLLRSLLQVTSPPFAPPHGPARVPKVVISYRIRSLSKETPFWAAFGLWFAFEPVLIKSHHVPAAAVAREALGDFNEVPPAAWTRFGSPDNGDTYVFVGRRRPESFGWQVPADDAELLGGVGAGGTQDRKGDDTFDTLLLMQMQMDV